MITLNEFIVKKKIQNLELTGGERTIKFPIFSGNFDDVMHYEGVKNITIPRNNFYIYNDKYHKAKHIICFNDLMYTLGSLYYNFEDFNAKDIVAGFDTLKDAVEYAINDPERYYDSKKFMKDVLSGDIKDEEYLADYDRPYDISIAATLLDLALVDNEKDIPKDIL